MSEKDRWGETLRAVQRAKEDQHFAKRDRDLIEKLRAREHEEAADLLESLAEAPKRMAGDRKALPSVTSPVKLNRILVPTDFSESSLGAVEYGAAMARPNGAKLELLFVAEPIYVAEADAVEAQIRLARQQLLDLENQLKKRRLRVESILEAGQPALVIAQTARSREVDVIVMSTHGRSGLAHFLMGSVAERVLRLAHCPVMMVRQHDARGPKKAKTREAKKKKATK